jgi:predicted GNAT superfamily acetyltransferase
VPASTSASMIHVQQRATMSIDTIDDVDGVDVALQVLESIWGPGVCPTDLLLVIARTGGYVAVARLAGEPVGASFGLLAEGGRHLHSHMTGVIAAAAGTGVGARIKEHQRSWALEQGIAAITWTFDPLIRRNAWFNLAKLGARATAYHENYYGARDDLLNSGDETDRLFVLWPIDRDLETGPIEAGKDDLVVETPPDIERLRVDDPEAASTWRTRLRAHLLEAQRDGRSIAGITTDGGYVLRRTR